MNLYICLTPLQILIANKLIELKQEPSDVLILTYNLNEKYDYYVDVISSNSNINQVSTIKIEDNTFYKKLNTLKKIRQWCGVNNYNTVSLASIDNFFMHAVLTYSQAEEIYTFDDGTANIVPTSSYFIKKDSFINKCVKFFLGIKWDLYSIKQQLKKHYTIYHNMKNIVDEGRLEYIDVFSIDTLVLNEQNKNEIYMYLGQPFKNKMVSVDTYKKLKEIYPDIQYYPHPREDISDLYLEIRENDVLQSNIIIEDYVSSLLKKGYVVQLFTVCSSAGFNLYNTKGVDVFFIIDDSFEEVRDMYIFIKNSALKVIYLK